MDKPNIVLYFPSKLNLGIADHHPSDAFERELLERIQILHLPSSSPAHGKTQAAVIPGISSGKDLFEWYIR
jgi:hypothetical protein